MKFSTKPKPCIFNFSNPFRRCDEALMCLGKVGSRMPQQRNSPTQTIFGTMMMREEELENIEKCTGEAKTRQNSFCYPSTHRCMIFFFSFTFLFCSTCLLRANFEKRF